VTAVEVAQGGALVSIMLAGAEVRRWTVQGRELSWPGDLASGRKRTGGRGAEIDPRRPRPSDQMILADVREEGF
jgi:hypothetical protein